MAEQRNGQGHQKKLILASFFITIFTIVVFGLVLMPGPGVGYAPTQPIPYSHELHAGKRKIQCIYCHSNVERSPHANVPTSAVCMNCHRVVMTESPHIQKLTELHDSGKPVEWVNVHVLPDFVYFNHERHVQKGVSCETCHGNVAGMEKVQQVNPLTMGWCVNCHRQPENQAPLDCVTCHR